MNRAVPHMIASAALAVIAVAAPASAAVVAFTGSFTNDTLPPAPNPSCAMGQVMVSFSPLTATTSGASNFGSFGPSQSHCLVPPPPGVGSSYSGGSFNFAFDLGNELFGTTSGELVAIDGQPGFFDSFVHYVVTGGTGRFAGASGAIEGVGVVNRTVPRPINNLALTGQLDLPAVVPEPATWALMIAGFGMAGAALRRRRTVPAI